MATLFAFLHHVSAFTLVAAFAVEFVLLRGELTLSSARKLQVADIVVAVSATILLAVGLMRVFFFEKGAAYYFQSHAFLGKISLFVLVALISAIPTIEFISWGKPIKAGQVPAVTSKKLRALRSIIHAELAGVVLILLFAAIMAKGGWN